MDLMKEREQDLRAFPHSNKAQQAQAIRYEYKEKGVHQGRSTAEARFSPYST
jgi:hypothetical protein